MKPRTLRLAILDGYAVRWDRLTVARDLVQNFFDEVADFSAVKIEIDAKKKRVRVAGPSTFALDYLRYVGATTKGGPQARTAGGFGEGFKICALVLLRDYGVELVAGSGTWEIRPALLPVKLGRELCYEVTEKPASEAFPGSYVELANVDKRLREELARVRDEFRHPANPRLQRPIFVDAASGAGIYEGKESGTGDIFYRRQRRGQVRFPLGGAVTFALDAQVTELEADRDRRNLRAVRPLLEALLPLLPDDALVKLLDRLRPYWGRGHQVLTRVLQELGRRGLKHTFTPRWVARSNEYTHHALEEHAERSGLLLGVRHLALAGCPSVADRFGRAQYPREAKPVEAARLALVAETYRALKAPLAATALRVVDIENRWASRSAGEGTAWVPARLLESPGREAFAPALAALARVGHNNLSGDGALRLTKLIEAVLAAPEAVDRFEAAWGELAVDPDRTLAEQPMGRGLVEAKATRSNLGTHALLSFEVLAPSGLPGVEPLLRRVADHIGEEDVMLALEHVPIDGPLDAIVADARGGLPCVRVGGKIVQPVPGAGATFEARTFQTEGGEALLPAWEELRPLVDREVLGARRHWAHFSAYSRGRRALKRLLARTDPAAYQRMVVKWEVSVYDVVQEKLSSAWYGLVLAVTRARLVALPSLAPPPRASAEYDRAVEEASGEVAAEVAAELAPLVERFHAALEITGQPKETIPLWRYQAAVAAFTRAYRGSPGGPEEALRQGREAFDAWAGAIDILASREVACYCAGYAWRAARRDREPNAPPDETLLAELLDEAAALHASPDELGRERNCLEFSARLDERFGKTEYDPVRDQSRPAVAAAVRTAWEEARAAGRSEREAMQACLAAARQVPVPPPWSWEKNEDLE